MKSSTKSETFIDAVDNALISFVAAVTVVYDKLFGENARVRRICAIVLLPVVGLACFAVCFIAWGIFVGGSAYADYPKATWLTMIIISAAFVIAGLVVFTVWFNLMSSDDERRASRDVTH